MDATQPEVWRPVVGWEDSYEVSDRGRIRSLDRYRRKGPRPRVLVRGRVMKPKARKNGYYEIALSSPGAGYRYRLIHRLVLEAFIGPCPRGWEGCHNDGDPAHNHLTNLRWDTFSNNKLDMVRHGTHNCARKTECLRGHEFTPENTLLRKNGRGRKCRECQRQKDHGRKR